MFTTFSQKVEKLEKQQEELEAKLESVENDLSQPDIYEESAKDKLKKRLEEQAELKRQLNATEEQWITALEELEAMEELL